MGKSPVEDFFAQYEDLALAVIEDERPNIEIGTEMCNADMAEAVCQIMNWECFDLFDEYDFAMVYKSGTPPMVMAFCYIAYLRWELWLSASVQKIGDADFNEKACAYDELWYLKLRDRYGALVSGRETKHGWLQ